MEGISVYPTRITHSTLGYPQAYILRVCGCSSRLPKGFSGAQSKEEFYAAFQKVFFSEVSSSCK